MTGAVPRARAAGSLVGAVLALSLSACGAEHVAPGASLVPAPLSPPSSARLPAAEIPELVAEGRTIRVPVLMYHHIGDPEQATTPEQRRYVIRPAAFRQQLQWLADHGYASITVRDFGRALRGEDVQLPAKPVLLTFDDGLRDTYTRAFPILREEGFTAALFVYTDAIRSRPGTDPERGFLSWEELVEMQRSGIVSIESHSSSHAYMTSLDPEALAREVVGSKRRIEEEVGVPVRAFSYPYGDVDDTIRAAVRDAGYEFAVKVYAGVDHPVGSGFLDVTRIEVMDDLPRFIQYVEWRRAAPPSSSEYRGPAGVGAPRPDDAASPGRSAPADSRDGAD